jgi:hypothetical protein
MSEEPSETQGPPEGFKTEKETRVEPRVASAAPPEGFLTGTEDGAPA